MDNCKKELLDIIRRGLQSDLGIHQTWQHLMDNAISLTDNSDGTTDVTPLLTSNWDQGAPYNAMCPPEPSGPGGHVLVGCVATAMAQVMYYWRYPNTGQGSHCDFHTYNGQQYCADFGNTTYDWNGSVNAPSKQCDPVALISYHAGISVNMQYGPAASGAYTSSIPAALENYFRYSTTTYYQARSSNYTSWTNQIKADLDAKRPVIYAGQGPDGGHCFVCDGYQGTDMFHFNWGWSGANNGYYNINNLNPGGMTFNNGQEAVFNIQPDPAQYPSFCTGPTNLTDYGFGTIEDGSGPVADYQNNASCSWLIAPDDSVSNIVLSFIRFSTDPGDVVKIYDGSTTNAPLIGTYSGNNIPPDLTSSGPQLLVTFTTNSVTTAPGWLANYTCNYIPFCSSSTTLTSLSGSFTDGSGRFTYRNSSMCKWKIVPDCFSIGSTTLTFGNFNTEENNDKVQVYDLSNGVLLGTYSGHYSVPPAPVTSPSGKLLIIFTTNSSIRDAGWEANYAVDCLNVGVDEKENVKISTYPNPAQNELNISIDINDTQKIRLELISLDGKTVFTESWQSVAGQHIKKLDVFKYTKGVYVLQFIGEHFNSNNKVVLQ